MSRHTVVLWDGLGEPRFGEVVGVSKRFEYLPATEETEDRPARKERVVRWPETWYQKGVFVRFADGGLTFASNSAHGQYWCFV